MLRLSEHLTRNKPRVSRVVGDDEQLARTSRRIDRHGARDLDLCLGNICITRPDDAINPWYTLGTIRECGDRSCTAECKDPISAGKRRRSKHDVGYSTSSS